MNKPSITLLLTLALASACQPDQGSQAAPSQGAEATAAQPSAQLESPTAKSYDAVLSVHDTMNLILNPSADFIWDSAGTIITAEGRTELAPTTDDGWAEVYRHAAILTESGNLLMMPKRSEGERWNAYAQAIISTGQLAMDAAKQKNSDALFDAGGEIYQVCKSCHSQYWVDGPEDLGAQ